MGSILLGPLDFEKLPHTNEAYRDYWRLLGPVGPSWAFLGRLGSPSLGFHGSYEFPMGPYLVPLSFGNNHMNTSNLQVQGKRYGIPMFYTTAQSQGYTGRYVAWVCGSFLGKMLPSPFPKRPLGLGGVAIPQGPRLQIRSTWPNHKT